MQVVAFQLEAWTIARIQTTTGAVMVRTETIKLRGLGIARRVVPIWKVDQFRVEATSICCCSTKSIIACEQSQTNSNSQFENHTPSSVNAVS